MLGASCLFIQILLTTKDGDHFEQHDYALVWICPSVDIFGQIAYLSFGSNLKTVGIF